VRILCLTSSFPRHRQDHAGRFVFDLVQALAAAGDAVEVIAPEDPRVHPEPLGIPVFRVPYFLPRRTERLFYGSGAPENLSQDPLACLQALPATLALAGVAAAHARRADVILAHWLVPAGVAGAAAAALSGRPLVAVAHSSDVHLLSRIPGGLWLLRFLAARASAICAVAREVAGRLAQLGLRARTLPLGVGRFVPRDPRPVLRRRLGLAGRQALLGLGRLVPVKGFDLLVEAARAIPRATVVLAGEGSEHLRLARRATRLGVDLRLLGVVTGPEKADLLGACDVAAFPSRRLKDGRTDGLPVALLEAMSAGLPVIGSAVGGIPEAMGGAGLLFPPEDIEGLREALSLALRRRRSLARLARKRAAHFELGASAERYRALLQEVAGR
jgi:glycosyltransferase involved in cell wall biosynthesis